VTARALVRAGQERSEQAASQSTHSGHRVGVIKATINLSSNTQGFEVAAFITFIWHVFVCSYPQLLLRGEKVFCIAIGILTLEQYLPF